NVAAVYVRRFYSTIKPTAIDRRYSRKRGFFVIKPKALKAGDTIGIVAAASNIKKDLLDQGCRELESLGFKTNYRPDIVSSFRYFAGTRERRRGEFLEMLKSPDIHAIFCARGGYGSGQLIPGIEADVIREN